MKDVIIYDEELDLTFKYTWSDKHGYNCRLPSDLKRDQLILYMDNCRKHWPEVPEHLKAAIDEHKRKIIDFCRNLPIDED